LIRFEILNIRTALLLIYLYYYYETHRLTDLATVDGATATRGAGTNAPAGTTSGGANNGITGTTPEPTATP